MFWLQMRVHADPRGMGLWCSTPRRMMLERGAHSNWAKNFTLKSEPKPTLSRSSFFDTFQYIRPFVQGMARLSDMDDNAPISHTEAVYCGIVTLPTGA
jgi:hypothetical protein